MSMTSTEAAILCRYVAACCPQQKFDEYTPDAWFDLLGDLPFDMCKAAAREVAKRQPFVSPSEIRIAVAQQRRVVRAALRDSGWKPAEWDGESPYRDWQQRHNAEIDSRVTDLIRSGADLSDVGIKPGPDEDWGVPIPHSLIESIAAALPQIERA